ncbi:hypothetical protein D3C71_979290 [compost metagenome]
MERVAQFHEVDLLARGINIHRAAVDHGIVGHDSDGPAAQPGQHRDDGLAIGGADLEAGIDVAHHANQPLHVVGLRAPLRHDGGQRFVAPVHRVIAGDHRRQLPNIVRHETQESTHLLECLGLRVNRVVYRSGQVHGHARAAQVVLVDGLAQRPLHHGRARGEDLAGRAHHHGKVRKYGPPSRAARRGAQHGGDDGDFTQQLNRALETMHAGKHAVAAALQRGHAAARAVDQIDQRNAIVVRKILHEAALAALAASTAEGRTAPHGEILAAEGHGPAVDAGQPADVGRGYNGDQAIVGVVRARAGQRADFAEAAAVDQPVDALAYRQPIGLMLPLDGRRAAHFQGLRAAKGQLLHSFLVAGWHSVIGRHVIGSDRGFHGCTTHKTWPSSTMSPGATLSAATVPPTGTSTGISIFMDSRIRTTSPSCTRAPLLHSTFQTVPVVGASISTFVIVHAPLNCIPMLSRRRALELWPARHPIGG